VVLHYDISVDESQIRVRTSGVFDFLKVYEMWERISATCKEHNCFKVLGRSDLQKPIPTMDAYDHLSIFEAVGITPQFRIAWVAENSELVDKLRLTETVLRNHAAINLRVFESVRDGEKWLMKDSKDSH